MYVCELQFVLLLSQQCFHSSLTLTIISRSQFADNTFHPGTYGGARHFTLSEIDAYLAETTVLGLLEASPSLMTNELREPLRSVDDNFANLTNHYVYRTLEKYKYTFKKKCIKHKHKFHDENIR